MPYFISFYTESKRFNANVNDPALMRANILVRILSNI